MNGQVSISGKMDNYNYNWTSICSAYPNSTSASGALVIWLNNLQDFSECFHDLYQTVAHSVFLFCIILYTFICRDTVEDILRKRRRRQETQLSTKKTWLLRAVVSSIILLALLLREVLLWSFTDTRLRLGLISHGCHAVQIITWSCLLYQTYLVVTERIVWQSHPEHQLVHFFFFLPVLAGPLFEIWSSTGATFLGMPVTYRIFSLIFAVSYILLVLTFIGSVSEITMAPKRTEDDLRRLFDEEHFELPSVATAYEKANIISRLFFWWTNGLIRNGPFLRTTEQLFDVPKDIDFMHFGKEFRSKISADPKTSKFYLPRILFQMWGAVWLWTGFLALMSLLSWYTSPMMLQKLVEVFQDENSDLRDGYPWAAGILIATILSSLFHSHRRFQMNKISACVSSVLMDSTNRKVFTIYKSDLDSKELSGKVINLLGTDCEQVDDGMSSLHDLWLMPLEIIVCVVLLYLQVGVAFLGGIGVVVVLLIINQVLASRVVAYEEKQREASDKRIKIITEILNCIRVIKFHAWEKFFDSRATKTRTEELRWIKRVSLLGAAIASIWQIVPVGMSVATFSIYILMGNPLIPSKLLTSIALFRMLNVPLMTMAWVIVGLLESWVSVKRLQSFFSLPDVASPSPSETLNNFDEHQLVIENASFSAQKDSEADASVLLKEISFTVRPGEFIGITGRIGSGKTLLLNAIIRELHKVTGANSARAELIEEGFGFVPQEPWILQGTVRDNILFGVDERDMDARFYHNVLKCCALTTDLENFTNGDRTEIGERGVTLSGGQKARLALARAVFQKKSIILMDDPLAAVDAHVARTIHESCILGLLANTTRVLVTHNTEHLRECDRVLLMANGKIKAVGTPDEVLSLPMEDHEDEDAANVPALARQQSAKSSTSEKETDGKEESNDSALTTDEESETGVVKFEVYLAFFRAIGWPSIIIGGIFLLLNQGAINAADIWISYWISSVSEHNSTVAETKYFLVVYESIAGGAVLTCFGYPLVLFLGCVRASKIFHQLLLNVMLRAKMLVFDTTPTGRILNRFSKDISDMDQYLPLRFLIFCMELLGGTFGTLAVLVYSLPWFAVVIIPTACIYYAIQKHYRHAAREIKRLEATTLSPLFSLYSECVHGLVTIRSMRASDRFCQRFSALLLKNQKALFASQAVEEWLELRLMILGALIISGVLLIGFLTGAHSVAMGLALSYSLAIIGCLSGLVESFISLEKGMVHVERLHRFIEDVEPERSTGNLKAMPQWPQGGEVRIQDLCIQYKKDLPDVLQNVNLTVTPKEKIGIVGRTGAGKSTLMLALFRMVEARTGSISIDGIDISQLDLYHLRSRLTIIPQTPSLFDASIRENLDPLSNYDDTRVWDVIEKCHLRPVLEKLGDGLTSSVGENGQNLSAGEKQLVSLARALLSDSKIICLDEATANIDYETDQMIQKTIRECMASSTILTIAHRVQTVLDCDRIIVISDGKIVEQGKPSDLLQIPSSYLKSLVQDAG